VAAGQFDVLALAAMCIVLGLATRIAAAVFAVLFAWWFLSDQTNYLNHFYLITLVSILLVFVPTDRAFSLEARYRRAPGTPRSREDETVPAWALWLVRFQIGAPYFFGGIAKLNPDWIAGEPMRMWLAERKSMPILGAVCTEEWCVSSSWSAGCCRPRSSPRCSGKDAPAPAFVAALLSTGRMRSCSRSGSSRG
jgi:hypothetical protein